MQSAVDIERKRLLGIITVAFEPGHYHPKCKCLTCVDTRHNLMEEDEVFLDSVVDTVVLRILRRDITA